MHIGFYRYSLLNRGGDRIVIEYANHLIEIGHNVTFYVSQIDTLFYIHPGIDLKKVSLGSKLGFLLYAAILKGNVDLIIADIIHLPLLLCIRNRVVYFAQANDIEYYANSFARLLMDILYRSYFRLNQPVITVSESLTKIFNSRYAPSEIYTVVNGINCHTFYVEPDDDLLELKADRIGIVFLARGDVYRKGYDFAMQVFGILNDDNLASRFELWVCGNHLEEGGYRFPVRNFGVVSDVRLRQILSSADIFFYPSRHEGFGLFPLEAMACGCAVVTTDAVPYARQVPTIKVAPIGDCSAMASHLTELIRSQEILAESKKQSIVAARKYDIAYSKMEFVKALEMVNVTRVSCE